MALPPFFIELHGYKTDKLYNINPWLIERIDEKNGHTDIFILGSSATEQNGNRKPSYQVKEPKTFIDNAIETAAINFLNALKNCTSIQP